MFKINKISLVDNLSVIDDSGMSLLHYASIHGHTDIAQYVAQRVSKDIINSNNNQS